MKNFEIISTEELQNIKGGYNEMTEINRPLDCIV